MSYPYCDISEVIKSLEEACNLFAVILILVVPHGAALSGLRELIKVRKINVL